MPRQTQISVAMGERGGGEGVRQPRELLLQHGGLWAGARAARAAQGDVISLSAWWSRSPLAKKLARAAAGRTFRETELRHGKPF
jgi:hypothetical protein